MGMHVFGLQDTIVVSVHFIWKCSQRQVSLAYLMDWRQGQKRWPGSVHGWKWKALEVRRIHCVGCLPQSGIANVLYYNFYNNALWTCTQYALVLTTCTARTGLPACKKIYIYQCHAEFCLHQVKTFTDVLTGHWWREGEKGQRKRKRETERRWDKERCTQLYNEAIMQNTKVEMFYVV